MWLFSKTFRWFSPLQPAFFDEDAACRLGFSSLMIISITLSTPAVIIIFALRSLRRCEDVSMITFADWWCRWKYWCWLTFSADATFLDADDIFFQIIDVMMCWLLSMPIIDYHLFHADDYLLLSMWVEVAISFRCSHWFSFRWCAADMKYFWCRNIIISSSM